jgi:hypothetical protein
VEQSEALELVAPPSLGVVCFRRRFGAELEPEEVDRRNAALVSELERTGQSLLSSTKVGGRYAIRMCVLNHTSRALDVERALTFLERAGVPGEAPRKTVRSLNGAGRPPTGASLPLFHGVTPEVLRRALEPAAERQVPAGETIVREWDQSRDFFMILDGAVEVIAQGSLVRTLGAGDFFGELGAFDWGAGYHYSRTATVRTSAPTRLLVLPDGGLNRLMGELPLVEARVRAVAGRRLAERGLAGT